MVIEGRAVAYGRPAAALLAERVHAAKGGDALAPVTVVVPSNYAAVAARRALAARPPGVANVTFVTLHRLAERLGAARLAAAGRRPVSVPVLAEAVRAVLEEPSVFERVADHPATEQALVRATQELAGVRDDALDAVAACSDRARDVVRIARATRARLAPCWHDEQDLLEAAAAALRDATAPPEGPVVVHLLQELSAGGAELLRALAETGAVEALVGVTGDPAADAPVLAAHARAGITVAVDGAQEPCCARRIVSASDPDDEVRTVVRQVAAWMRDDVPLGRIALLYGTADPYRRLLHEHLSAAGIPVNGSPVTAVGDQLLGRTVRALLALPDRDFRRSDVLAVLTGAPVLAGGGRAPSRAWERVSRLAGVVGGGDWDLRLTTFAVQQRERAVEAERDDEELRAEHFRRDADRADQLASFVRDLRTAVERGTSLDRWSDLAAWTADLAETYLGGEQARASWPEHERLAAERVEQAIERLAALDGVGGPAPTVEGFRRTLEQELETAVRRVGRLGDGVLVGHVSVATGLVLDRVAVLGLAEGVFPPRRLEDSLLPDAERAVTGGELALRADRLHEDRRHLLASVAAADEAVLSSPRGDLRRSGERPASRWLLADAARLAGADRVRSSDLAALAARPEAAWLEHAPSFAGGLGGLALAATEQELRLAAVARGDPDHAVLGDPLVQAAAEVVRERRSDRFTRFDGNLAGVVGPEVLSRRFSATRLQTWATCPHRYLLQYLLHVEPVEEPERRLEIDALATGSLVHEVLDRFVREAVDCGHPLDGWGPADERRLLAIADECFASYEAMGLTGRALLWRRDRERILADLRRFLVEDSARLAAGIRPLRTELEFDDLQVPLPDGTTITVRGAVDRVDRKPDGALVVLDYKTGGDRRYKDLSDADPHLHGTKLQPYLYARAAAEVLPSEGPVWAGYWFTSDKGRFICRGYLVTPEVAARVEDALVAITSGIAAGTFPARPNPQPGWGYVDCWYCTPDGLSAAERRREWEAKRHDPQVRAYADLAEPEDDGG